MPGFRPWLPQRGLVPRDAAAAAQRLVSEGAVVGFGPFENPTLAFPSGRGAETIPIAYGGTLWRLKQLAKDLQRAYGWEEAQAVGFVFEGAVPILPRGWVRLSWGKSGPRVALEVDARFSRTEVARLYGRWRGYVFQGADKPIERKAGRLAVFAEEYRDSGLSWRQLMALWNRRYPEWPYHTPVHFARDCQLAWQRVTGKKWPRKKAGRRRGKEAGAR